MAQQEPKEQERRVQKRLSMRLQARLCVEYEPDQITEREETVTVNISSGGALLLTEQKLPLASKVHLEFHVNLEELKKLRFILSVDSLRSSVDKKIWVKATGIVIRTQGDGVGIIFDQDYQLSPMEGPHPDRK